MPGKPLPSYSPSEVKSHSTAKSCWVTRGSKVYDVTSFLDDHPGGGDLILEYAGRDVDEILGDVISHEHSEVAYEILSDYLVGVLSSSDTQTNGTVNGAQTNGAVKKDGQPVYATTGLSSEEELSVDTDANRDYQQHKFLDLNRPLFGQLWFGGFDKEFYLEQVHRPRHYKGGASAPLFGNFLEPLTKTAWYIVPIVWLPWVAYGVRVGMSGLDSVGFGCAHFALGLAIWTLLEYVLHRCLFHIDKYLPNNRVGVSMHFLLHGIHHYLPMDRYRLVMPPSLFLILATPFYPLAHRIIFYNWHAGVLAYCGGIFGYICYDLTHYFLHHSNLPAYYRSLKKYHLQHHFADYENGFGVTSRFWDKVFGTELAPLQPPKSQ